MEIICSKQRSEVDAQYAKIRVGLEQKIEILNVSLIVSSSF